MHGDSEIPLELDWLIRLRWAAVAGAVLLLLMVGIHFSILIPWVPVVTCLTVAAASNLWAWIQRERATRRMTTALILGDIVLLTVLLYFTGGAHNPFTVLYLLHIILAVMLIDRGLAWFAVGLCAGCFALLFRSPHMLMNREGVALCDDLDFHLQGMLLATVLTGGGVVYFISRLNAALRRQREQARLAREAAEREHRFASLVTMAAGVAHELATPLGTIAVASRELEREAEGLCRNQACSSDLQLIRREVERCREIIQKMSSQTLGENRHEPESIPCALLEERLAEYLSPAMASALSLRVEIDPEVRELYYPPDPLLRSLALLLKNAREASSPDQEIVLSIHQGREGIRIEVRDRGAGMSREVLERLGEPFFTTKEAGAGMGLGFFLARALVEKLGGTLTVESELGQGTSVWMNLPLRESKLVGSWQG